MRQIISQILLSNKPTHNIQNNPKHFSYGKKNKKNFHPTSTLQLENSQTQNMSNVYICFVYMCVENFIKYSLKLEE